MVKSNYYLFSGGIISALVSIFHIILSVKPELYQYITPDQNATLSQMAEEGSSMTIIASLALVAIFAIWALYAFSGAGLIRQLPLLHTGLILIAVFYLLRCLFIPSEITMVQKQAYPTRFVLFSALSLFTGLLYLVGFLNRKRLLAIHHSSRTSHGFNPQKFTPDDI